MENTEKEVFISRIFDAPRELVFKAWTDPEQLARWYAPNGCTIHFSSIDVVKGGRFHSCVRSPKFHDCWCVGVYKEIIVPEKIVFTMAVSDEKGNLLNATDAGMDPDWPEETTVTVSFEEIGSKTRLTLHQTVGEALAKRTGAHPSWIEMMDRLAAGLVIA